jgi:hypothetical protein
MQQKKPPDDTYSRWPTVPSMRLPPLTASHAGNHGNAREHAMTDDRDVATDDRRKSGRMSAREDATLPQSQGEKEKPREPDEGSKTQNKGDRR